MRSATLITATSVPFAAKMKARYRDKVDVVENGFDPDDFAALPAASIFPDDGKFRIVYTGTIYPGKQDATPFFQALGELAQNPILENLEVLFVGHQLEHLTALAHRFHVAPYVRILGFVNREEALRMQRDAHLLLFIVWKDLSERGVFSGKIYEYLFSGTEIMAIGAEGMEESQALILESGAGVALHQVAAIKQSLIEKLRLKKKTAIQPVAEVLGRYNRHSLAQKLLEKVL